VRYFNVFGPRQDPLSAYAAVIPKFVTLMLDDQPAPIEGDGLQSRDFTYIENVIHGNLLACHTEGVAGEVFNIACGDRINLLDMVGMLNKLLGKHLDPVFVDARPAMSNIHVRLLRRPNGCWVTTQLFRLTRALRAPWMVPPRRARLIMAAQQVVHLSKMTGAAGSEGHLLVLLHGQRTQGIDARLWILVEPDNPVQEIVDSRRDTRYSC